mmetsp:Transcript_48895/g.148791  ORF Transcript_48895/g.148791 Transcript_48895/m.148791 type:complete len:285 (+) Transcript_48895:273-1127(+)
MSALTAVNWFGSPTRCVKPVGSVIRISETCCVRATTRSGSGSSASKPRVIMEDRRALAWDHLKGTSWIFSRSWMSKPGTSTAASRTMPCLSFRISVNSLRKGCNIGGVIPMPKTYSPGTMVLLRCTITCCGVKTWQPPVSGKAMVSSSAPEQPGAKPSGRRMSRCPPASTSTWVLNRHTMRVRTPGMPAYVTAVSAICCTSMPGASPQPYWASEKTSRPSMNHAFSNGALAGVDTTILISGTRPERPGSRISNLAVFWPLGIGVEGLQSMATPPPSTKQPREKL